MHLLTLLLLPQSGHSLFASLYESEGLMGVGCHFCSGSSSCLSMAVTAGVARGVITVAHDLSLEATLAAACSSF